VGFFDFTARLAHYEGAGLSKTSERLNKRHRFLIAPYKDDIAGARVLDLASHDGRWAYAFAGAGAASVYGVEARAGLIAQFDDYPDPCLRSRVDLHCNDLFEELQELTARGATFDVIGVFGILYHVMDHHRLFVLLRQLDPKLIIIDSEFIFNDAAMVRIVRERTDNPLNATAHFSGQQIVAKGVPSRGAMQVFADTLGFDLVWDDWDRLNKDERNGVADYYRQRSLRRATCALRPKTTVRAQ